MQSKKQLILWVLNVLNNESDESHPLTQTKIADVISDIYPCDRKTVGRNIKTLKEMGYPIIKTKEGFYIERKAFSVDEVNFIKNAILNDAQKNEAEKQELVERVTDILTKIYRR